MDIVTQMKLHMEETIQLSVSSISGAGFTVHLTADPHHSHE